MGTKQPTNRWLLFPRLITGTETFRLSHSLSSKKPYKLGGHIGQFFFGNDSPVGVRRIWPIFGEKPVINLDIPENLRQAGYVSRFIGIRLSPKFQDPNGYIKWYVSLEELNDSTTDRIDHIKADISNLSDRFSNLNDALNDGLNNLIG